MELTPYRAYGFRLYRNESELYMHVDKSQTHVVSFILHIDSSEDAEPWPILIEDFDGSKYCQISHSALRAAIRLCDSQATFFHLFQRDPRSDFDQWGYFVLRIVEMFPRTSA